MNPISTKIKYSFNTTERLKSLCKESFFHEIQYSKDIADWYKSEENSSASSLGFSVKSDLMEKENILPKELFNIVRQVYIVRTKAGEIVPKHKDKTRLSSLYFPILPTENYTPLYFNENRIENDGKIWLIDHKEYHWVDNSNGLDRYNLQITFIKTAEEVKELLNDLGLI